MTRSDRFGVWLGIDVGSVRIGVARCDPDGLLATPERTVARDVSGAGADIREIVALADDLGARGAIVGLPTTLRGELAAAAHTAQEFGAQLAVALNQRPVRYVDERMSTVTATRALRDSGVPGRKQRSVVDQAAAVVLLQHWLDTERHSRAGS